MCLCSEVKSERNRQRTKGLVAAGANQDKVGIFAVVMVIDTLTTDKLRKLED